MALSTVDMAANVSEATRPAPTTRSLRESARARYEAASAEAATVRREVISLPSITDNGSPVRASNSVYVLFSPGLPSCALPGKMFTIFTPKRRPTRHAGMSSDVPVSPIKCV